MRGGAPAVSAGMIAPGACVDARPGRVQCIVTCQLFVTDRLGDERTAPFQNHCFRSFQTV